jgi:hypothetical protein
MSVTRGEPAGAHYVDPGIDREGRYRRVSPIASGRGDGLLPDHRAGAQPQRQELVFMPATSHWRSIAKSQAGEALP